MPVLTRTQIATYAVATLVVVVLAVRFMQGQSHSAATAAAGRTTTAATGGAATGDVSAVRIESHHAAVALVHVAGAVQRPGVYRLRDGERIQDAVRRAGGARRGADLNAINLAAKVADGQQVVVPRRGSPGSAQAADTGASGAASAPSQPPVSLNTASAEQLDTLDGVGPATARKILDYRREHGGFRSIDDLGEVPGIGPKKLAALRTKVQL
jgi:competence protein ComEA